MDGIVGNLTSRSKEKKLSFIVAHFNSLVTHYSSYPDGPMIAVSLPALIVPLTLSRITFLPCFKPSVLKSNLNLSFWLLILSENTFKSAEIPLLDSDSSMLFAMFSIDSFAALSAKAFFFDSIIFMYKAIAIMIKSARPANNKPP